MNKIVGAFLVLFLFAVSVRAADKIRIGYPGPAAQFIPLPLAQMKGFLKEEGLGAEFVQMSGTVSIAALVNGDIDYYATVDSGVRAALQGLPVKVVACYVPAPPMMLVTLPEFKSVKGLKGRIIGIQSFGSTIDIIARMILKHFGLDPERDVKFLAT